MKRNSWLISIGLLPSFSAQDSLPIVDDANKIKPSSITPPFMFSPFRRIVDTFRERGATTPEKALTWKELGFPERLEHVKPPFPPDMDPIVRVGNKYYLSEERLALFQERVGFPSPMRKWLQHTAKVPKGFLRYRVLHKLKEHPMSGAELTSAIGAELDGRWKPRPGSMYPLLNSLHREGLTRQLSDSDGRTRRYELTDRGIEFLESEIDSCSELREKIENTLLPLPRLLLQDSEHSEEIPPSIRNLFQTLPVLPMVMMSDPSPQTLKELSDAAESLTVAIQKARMRIESRKTVH